MRVNDRRSLPFFQVGKAETERLADVCDARSLPYLRSLYFALLELANDHRADEVAASRGELSLRAGVSPATVKRLTPLLVESGLVHVQEVPGYPSVWTLLGVGSDRPDGSGHTDPGVGSASRGGAGHTDPTLNNGVKKERREEIHPQLPRAIEWVGVTDEMRADAESLLAQKRKVGNRLVTEREMAIAAAGLCEFNRQLESRFELGPWFRLIVERARDHPSWDAAAMMRLVQSAFRIRWWEKRNGGRPKPPVIWSESAFPNVVDDATREAEARREVEDDRDPRTKRYQPGNRPFEALTPAEQAHVIDLTMRGERPWLPESVRQGPVMAVNGSSNGNGNGHPPVSWTAENFAAE